MYRSNLDFITHVLNMPSILLYISSHCYKILAAKKPYIRKLCSLFYKNTRHSSITKATVII